MTNEQIPDFTPATSSEDVRLMQFGIRPDDLKARIFEDDVNSIALDFLHAVAEHFSMPFEPAEVSDEEINEKAALIFGEDFPEESEGIEEPGEEEEGTPGPDDASGNYWFTPFEFSLRLPLNVLNARDEATAFWFLPMRTDREATHSKLVSFPHAWRPRRHKRSFPNPLMARRDRPAAELDVHSEHWLTTLKGPSSQIEGLNEHHLFVLALPQRLDANGQLCRRCSPEQPSSSGKLAQGGSETLLVLFDSASLSTAKVAPWKQHSAAVGEYQWRSLDRGRRWLKEVAELFSERREVARSEVGAVLWLTDPQSSTDSPGAAALVPVPEWLQPARDHLPQLSELWDSTLRNHLAHEINDACRK
ncbi:hypothetical protein [Streptomyces sp. NPDC001536]|uniref:hypothetical protein n=1 Tax=Streptomyces sp. NPDC001536 TaxID=3364583 RepID=UPI0036BBC2E9